MRGPAADPRIRAPTRPVHLLRDWYDAQALLAAEGAPSIVTALLNGPLRYKTILATTGADSPGLRWGSRHRRLYDSILTRNLQALTRTGCACRVVRTPSRCHRGRVVMAYPHPSDAQAGQGTVLVTNFGSLPIIRLK